jgi:hypothetical protein
VRVYAGQERMVSNDGHRANQKTPKSAEQAYRSRPGMLLDCSPIVEIAQSSSTQVQPLLHCRWLRKGSTWGAPLMGAMSRGANFSLVSNYLRFRNRRALQVPSPREAM